MNATGHGQRLRLYRLWRTAAILCALGAVEIAVLAWQRQQPWLASVCLPLVAVARMGRAPGRRPPPDALAPARVTRVADRPGIPHIRRVPPPGGFHAV